MRLGITLICVDRSLELVLGFPKLLSVQVRGSQMVMCRREVRRIAERLLVMLNCVIGLTLLLRFHTLVELLEGLLRKALVILGRIDQVRIAARDSAGRVFLFLGLSRYQCELKKVYWRNLRIYVHIFRDWGIRVLVY